MKTLIPALLVALSFATAVRAADGPPPHTPLPPNECIKTGQINEWYIVDARRAIVRTGPKHYLVTLKNDCPNLNHPPGLIFRSSPTHSGISEGRICGALGETVHSTSQPPCAIESVSTIDKARFKQLGEEAKRYQRGGADAEPAR